jgi:hypothetical protein
MRHDQAKLAVLAMKSRELYSGRPYPATRADLRSRLSDVVELEVIDIVDRWSELRSAYEDDFGPLARLIDEFARNLVRQLESEEAS